tara:strand:+ start:930 stop:1064 length:135 start_codon:yes stop_codon:yes gene_type:complete
LVQDAAKTTVGTVAIVEIVDAAVQGVAAVVGAGVSVIAGDKIPG